jgi:flagellar motility protein MotE (MotC chaperone)
MKSGIIYGGVFLFTFVVVTGLIIFLNSTYENIFQFNFAPKSFVNLSDSTKTDSTQIDSLNIAENQKPLIQIDSTNSQDSILLSSLAPVETKDSVVTNMVVNKPVKNEPDKNKSDKIDIKQAVNLPESKSQKTDLTQSLPQNNLQEKNKNPSRKEYDDWLKKISGIYSSMEPKKAAKIIQTYSDNIARDILYNMNKKTAAKVVSEFNPETANKIFRFE